jgi:uncharacterized integral membrane protein
LVAKLFCRSGHLSAILFIADTNLIYVDTGKDQLVDEAVYNMQLNIVGCGSILMTCGNLLRSEKFCFLFDSVCVESRWEMDI